TLVGLWFFLGLGLLYTTEGVHAFLAEGTTAADPLWWAAWTVEPMFAGLLITLLNFEAVILSYGVAPDHQWWSRLKHVLLASTLAMNVILQITPIVKGEWAAFHLGSLAVHAIIPMIVYGIAEVIPVIQARQREIVLMVYDHADQHDTHTTPELEQPAETEPESGPATSAARAQKMSRVRLPDAVLHQITTVVEHVRTEGRQPSVADIQGAVRVPDAMTERILADFDDRNGYPVLS